jgi:pyruvate,orthophosphate dikinase
MGERVPFLIGTMIELPRAALTADEIARRRSSSPSARTTSRRRCSGLSRDDAGRFLPQYIEKGIYPDDPFQVIDERGVGKLIRRCIFDGRSTRPDLKVGICGEHGASRAPCASSIAAG